MNRIGISFLAHKKAVNLTQILFVKAEEYEISAARIIQSIKLEQTQEAASGLPVQVVQTMPHVKALCFTCNSTHLGPDGVPFGCP
jgi:hypothetical protein